MLNTLTILLVTLSTVCCYDCYDNKCHGWGKLSGVYKDCDQQDHYCDYEDNGLPLCVSGYNGGGVFCKDGSEVHCDTHRNGSAYCWYPLNKTLLWVEAVGGALLLAILLGCCWKRRTEKVLQPNYGAAGNSGYPLKY